MNQEQRDTLLARAQAHYKADMLMAGLYAREGKAGFVGCSVGCHLHDIHPSMSARRIDDLEDKHARVAKHYGYPEWLALLQDVVFEGLPTGEREKWHVQLAEVLHTTTDEYDWMTALHRVHAAILRISYRTAGSAAEAVNAILDLHERAGRGEDVSDDLWSAARSAAESAAESARSAAESARSAAESAAWSAAESAAWSARSAAESARSAAESARSAAESAAYQEMRDGILAALLAPSAA